MAKDNYYGLYTFRHIGNFGRTENYLKNLKNAIKMRDIEKYAQMGVDALREATPKDSGLTADSWYYKIEQQPTRIKIQWLNSNLVGKGIPLALLIQYGHAMPQGGYVQGIDYINPALKPVFEELRKKIWKEVTSA